MLVNRFLRWIVGPASILVTLTWLSASTETLQVVLRSDLVLVPVSVRDKTGRPVTDLESGDFRLYVSGKPYPISYFSLEADPGRHDRPLALTLVLDSSRSISVVLHQQQTAVVSLLNRVGKRTLVSLVAFSDQPHVLLEFTDDKQEAARVFQRRQRLGGNTAVFDAVRFAVERAAGHIDGEMRKVVVVISDGQDTGSAVTARQCIELAQEVGVAVYCVLIPIYSPYGDRLVVRRPVKGFRELATETGGKFFQVGTVEQALHPAGRLDLEPVFAAVVEDLQFQYYLGFHPGDDLPPGTHRLEVRVTSKKMKVELRRRTVTVRPSR